MTGRRLYACWLYAVPGIGNKTIRRLVDYAGEEEAVWRLSEKEAAALLSAPQLASFLRWRRTQPPEKVAERLERKGIAFRPCFAPDYPRRLRTIPDAPYAVYTIGTLRDDVLPGGRPRPAVAVVGARVCTAYGRSVADRIGTQLARAGITLVSGMARGIDGVGQTAALALGGDTVSVLGCGVDVCYPPEHRALYEACCARGLVLSEYAPGTQAQAGLFPARNRLISGLADAVIVVEAREKSGTLITVDMALEQGRDVYAVPGRLDDPLSAGCNRLIGQGAQPFTSVEDVLRMLAGQSFPAPENPAPPEEAAAAPPAQDGLQQALYALCDYAPRSLTDLYEQLRREPPWRDVQMGAVCVALTKLQLSGRVAEQGKNYYYRRK